MVLFRVLGDVAVGEGDDKRVSSSRIRRIVLALLLARPNRVVASDRIIDAVWPEESPEVARNRLWFHVSKLRSELTNVSLANRFETLDIGYRIALEHGELDAQLFEREAITGSDLIGDDPDRAVATLRQAMRRWKGPAFGDAGEHPVLSADVVRLEEMRMRAGEHLAEALVSTGRYDEAVELLRGLIVVDPYRERLRSQLMLALYARGRQAEAVELYDESIGILREDLGLEPSPTLRSMGQRILRQDPTLVPSRKVEAPRVAFSPRRPCVGRDEALAEMLAVATDPQPHASTLLVSGEAGAGKTAVLAEAAARASVVRPGLLVAAGVGLAAPGLPDDFGPLRQILDALVGDLESSVAVDLMTQQQVDALWKATPTSLDALLDAGSGLIGPLVEPSAVQSRSAAVSFQHAAQIDEMLERTAPSSNPRPSLVRQFAATLGRIASVHPVLLLLDDLHRAGRATIDVITVMARGFGKSPPAIIGAFRTASAELDGWGDLMSSLDERRLIDLDEKDEAARFAFVNALVDIERNALGDGFRRELTTATAGRALFVVEWMQSLLDRGDLFRSPDGVLLAQPNVSFAEWPRHLEPVIAERLGRLSSLDRRMLQIGAVEGDTFCADVVAELTDQSLDDVVALLGSHESGARHVLTADVPGRIGARRTLRYRFSHQLFRRFLYESLDPTERTLLHERVASALEALGGRHDDAVAQVIAEHLVRANIPERAAPYFRIAADRLIRSGDNRSALELLDIAQDLLASLPNEMVRSTAAQIQLSRGTALSVLRAFTDSEVEASFQAAIDLMGGEPDGSDGARAHWGLCALYLSSGAFAEAATTLETIERIRDAHTMPAMPALHLRWSLDLFRGELRAALEHTQRGRSDYRFRRDHPLTFEYGNHDPGVCAASLGSLARALRGQLGIAAQWAADATELAESLGHAPSHSQAGAFAMWVQHLADDPEAVVALHRGRTAGAAPLWDALAESLFAHAMGQIEGDDTADDLAAVLERQLAVNDVIFAPVTGTLLASELLRLGAPDEADAIVQRCWRAHPTADTYFWAPEMLRLAGSAAAMQGRLDEGATLIDRSITIAEKMAAPTLVARGRSSRDAL